MECTSHFSPIPAQLNLLFLGRLENSAALSDLSRQLCSVEYRVIQRRPSLVLYGASIIYVWS